jgi:hypothetical protein
VKFGTAGDAQCASAAGLDVRAKRSSFPFSVYVMLIVLGAATTAHDVVRAGAVAAEVELVLVGAVLLGIATLLFSRELRRFRGHGRPVSDEQRARALMGELCPTGWRAQIGLYGPGGGESDASLEPHQRLVSVDWSELSEGGEQVDVVRRVWSPTIATGLAAMVEDRRTDEVLERIERTVLAEDDPWDGS